MQIGNGCEEDTGGMNAWARGDCAPEVMPASCVLAPTSFMTAEREKDPVVV